MTKNFLANETSPYLLQHADNPVEWYPWGKEALEKAKREDKPILLSIGYSACHWCHVMAHESFENEAIAKLMNEFFVNIKVDREERPDLDKIYQTAYQLLSNRPGGWPLTVFLTPDQHIPFFAGTYFPATPQYGMPSFPEVLQFIDDLYRTRKADIEKQNTSLMQTFNQLTPKKAAQLQFNLTPVSDAIKKISANFDPLYGGFGDAPKFPQVNYLELLLRNYVQHQDQAALKMLEETLIKMAKAGIYDQLGGGFYRYSVDSQWQIPHFEKMLYDNAQLLTIYVETYALTKNPLFANIIKQTAMWVIREMQSPEGGYYSTLDADSEGHEGKFYVWDKSEIQKILTSEELSIIDAYFDLEQHPNFENKWHLQTKQSVEEIAAKQNLSIDQVKKILQKGKEKLFTAREERIRPGRDEKILPAWNGLMIKAMALAGNYLADEKFIDSAERALQFIQKNMWKNSHLLATYKDGRAHLQAYLDDYVFLIAGILTLLQAKWNTEYFNFALQLAETVLKHFQDPAQGGFFFTADDHEVLIYRYKPIIDEAIPAGNGVAALIFNRLGYLTGEKRFITAAEKTLEIAWENVQAFPEAHVTLLFALEEFLQPPEIVIIRGAAKEMQEWKTILQQNYLPQRLIFCIDNHATNLPEFLAEKKPQKDIVAYICRGFQCLPTVSEKELLSLKKAGKSPPL